MSKNKQWNPWTKVHLLMAAVFIVFCIFYILQKQYGIAFCLCLLSLHSFISTFLFYKYPAFASNTSNLSVFLQNVRSVILILSVLFIIPALGHQKPGTAVIIAIAVATLSMLYFTVQSFPAFLKDIKQGEHK